MDIEANISQILSYRVSYKKKNTIMLISWAVWLFVSVVNIIKIYKKAKSLEYWDAIWLFCIVAYSFAIVNMLMTKVTFNINNKQLTVINSALLYKKVKVYEIDRMEELEVEQIIVNKLFYKKPSGRYLVNFFYEGDTVELDGQMAKVQAEQLLNAILVAKNL